MTRKSRIPQTVSAGFATRRPAAISLWRTLRQGWDALGAGSGAVPLGDNGRAARRLARSAGSLCP